MPAEADNNIEETWVIEKNQGLAPAALLFFFCLALFLLVSFYAYFVERTTNVIFILLPLPLALITLSTFKYVRGSMTAFPEERKYRLTQEGIYSTTGQQEEKFLSWTAVRQYDQGQVKGATLVGTPERIVLRTDHEEESMEVVAFAAQMNKIRSTLRVYDVSFGYLRD